MGAAGGAMGMMGDIAGAWAQAQTTKRVWERTEEKMDRERDRLQAFLDSLVAPDAATNILQEMFTGGNLDSLIDFLTNRVPLTKAEKAHGRFFNTRAPLLVNEAIGRLQGVFPFMDELLRTGFKTDITPLREAGQYRLGTVDFPTILGRLGDQLGGSEVLSALGGASVDFERQLADLEYASSEAAAGRRTAGLGMAESVYSAPERVGREGYADIGYQGQLNRLRQESARTGAMPPVASWLDVLAPLSMVEQQHMIPMSGYGVPPGGADWSALAGIGGTAAGALGAAAWDWLRNRNSGGGYWNGVASDERGASFYDTLGGLASGPTIGADTFTTNDFYGNGSFRGGSFEDMDWSTTGISGT